MARLICLSVVWWLSISVSAFAEENTPTTATAEILLTDAAVRDAVIRSLPYLEDAGVEWLEVRGCMSCHHVPYLLWTHRVAQTKGLPVDAKKLAEWEEWSRKNSLAQRNLYRLQNYDLGRVDEAKLPLAIKEKLKPLIELPFITQAEFVAKLTPLLTAEELQLYQATVVQTAERALNAPDRSGGGLDVLGQLLLGSHGTDSGLASAEFRGQTAELMQRLQRPDGSWMPGNQLLSMRRWSVPAANQTTTMWASLALAAYEAPGQKRAEAVEKAITYQRQQPAEPDNHEWLATRLLFEKQFGSAEDVAKLHQQLLTVRNPDGGWGWRKDAPSDPYTTGIALYVLAKLAASADAAVILAARKFLLQAQQPDGSWLTPSKSITLATDETRLKARDEIYHYWGTAWAALGLLETLPAPERPGS